MKSIRQKLIHIKSRSHYCDCRSCKLPRYCATGTYSTMYIENLCNFALTPKQFHSMSSFLQTRNECASFSDVLKHMWDSDCQKVYSHLFEIVKIYATVQVTLIQFECTHSNIYTVTCRVAMSIWNILCCNADLLYWFPKNVLRHTACIALKC